jgi:hypothetical protein
MSKLGCRARRCLALRTTPVVELAVALSKQRLSVRSVFPTVSEQSVQGAHLYYAKIVAFLKDIHVPPVEHRLTLSLVAVCAMIGYGLAQIKS